MKKKSLFTLFISTALVSTAACTWVKPVDGTEGVALVKPELAQNCEKLSTTTVQVKHKVGFVSRSTKKVAQELLTMARNNAVQAGADTIVANNEPTEGSQSFGLYKCR